MAVEGDQAVTGHLHRAEIGTFFVRAYHCNGACGISRSKIVVCVRSATICVGERTQTTINPRRQPDSTDVSLQYYVVPC
jgi:hypothetical protein